MMDFFIGATASEENTPPKRELVLTIFLEGGRIKGSLDVSNKTTLADVRNQINDEFDDDMIPLDFAFYLINDVRICTKQEKKILAWDYLDKNTKELSIRSKRIKRSVIEESPPSKRLKLSNAATSDNGELITPSTEQEPSSDCTIIQSPTATTVVEVADGRENVKKRKTTTISSSQEEKSLLFALNESIKRSIKVQKKVDRKLGKLINILLEDDKNQEIEDDGFKERVCTEEATTIHHRYVTPNNRDTIENTTSMTALNLAGTMSREKPSENTLDLWTILEEKLGFKCMDGTYHLPEIKNANAYFSQHPSFSSLPEMQSYILENMFLLPWESKLNEGEKELVKYWVRTGNTTFPDETILSATSQSLPASFEPWALLEKLGFYYEPSGSDSTGPKYIIPNVILSNRIEGVLAMKNVLWFPSIEGVQEWCLRNGIPDDGKGDFIEERKQLKKWASNYNMLQVFETKPADDSSTSSSGCSSTRRTTRVSYQPTSF